MFSIRDQYRSHLLRFISFPNLQSLLIQLGVKEVLIPAEEKTSEVEAQKLRKLVERCGVVFTERKRSKFDYVTLPTMGFSLPILSVFLSKLLSPLRTSTRI